MTIGLTLRATLISILGFVILAGCSGRSARGIQQSGAKPSPKASSYVPQPTNGANPDFPGSGGETSNPPSTPGDSTSVPPSEVNPTASPSAETSPNIPPVTGNPSDVNPPGSNPPGDNPPGSNPPGNNPPGTDTGAGTTSTTINVTLGDGTSIQVDWDGLSFKGNDKWDIQPAP